MLSIITLQIVDPTATKPLDWDEDAPAQIVDPNAVKPDTWLEDEPETVPGKLHTTCLLLLSL